MLNYFIQFVFVFDLVLEKITVCSAKFYSFWELCWLSQLWVRKFQIFSDRITMLDNVSCQQYAVI